MYLFFALLILSVYIKRFIPERGFICDSNIDKLTHFGNDRRYELRDITGIDESSLISIKPIEIQQTPVRENTSTIDDSGIDLEDINAKRRDEVDISSMYSNIDESDESLSDIMGKVLK